MIFASLPQNHFSLLLSCKMTTYCYKHAYSCSVAEGCELGRLIHFSSNPRLHVNSHQQYLEPQQQHFTTHKYYSSATLPVSSTKHRSKFTNLRDSVKKSPTKSTAKVKATSGWWSDSSWSTGSFDKVSVCGTVC